MMLLFILLTGISFTACTNAVEDDANTIIVKYNDAIAEYQERLAMHQFWFGRQSVAQLNISQTIWNEVRKEFKLDSLMNQYHEKHGEKAYNKLRIKVDDNFDAKVNKQ